MKLNEIEKLRKIYSELKELWKRPELHSLRSQPLQDLSEMLEQAVWDRHNAEVDAAKLSRPARKESIPNNGEWRGATVLLPSGDIVDLATDGKLLRVIGRGDGWQFQELELRDLEKLPHAAMSVLMRKQPEVWRQI